VRADDALGFGPAISQLGVVHFRSDQVRTTHPRPGERGTGANGRAIRGVLGKFVDLQQEAEDEIRSLDEAHRRIVSWSSKSHTLTAGVERSESIKRS
jgi:hypothetical protein